MQRLLQLQSPAIGAALFAARCFLPKPAIANRQTCGRTRCLFVYL
jgi:hypothetical protein